MKSMRQMSIVTVAFLAFGLLLPSSGFANTDLRTRVLTIITSVNASKSDNKLTVTAVGEVPSGGYSNLQLVRVVYSKQPADGIQDYVLFATPPASGGGGAAVVTYPKVTNVWNSSKNSWVKGVRVHGIDSKVFGERQGVKVKMLSSSVTPQ